MGAKKHSCVLFVEKEELKREKESTEKEALKMIRHMKMYAMGFKSEVRANDEMGSREKCVHLQ